jgi:hypothetical protein
MNGMAWWPWLVLLLLGAGHGLNPGMGWLFAVALGMQEGRPGAVWRALGPLAVGHAAAVALALGVAVLVGAVVPLEALKWVVALLLGGVGIYRLAVNRHPRFGGMRVGPRDLTLWSLLMASAHGAGLMVVPVVLAAGSDAHAAHPGHAIRSATLLPDPLAGSLMATVVHTAGYLLVTGLIAVTVYRRLGLRLLRTAWINLDVIWAGALIATGVATAIWG